VKGNELILSLVFWVVSLLQPNEEERLTTHQEFMNPLILK